MTNLSSVHSSPTVTVNTANDKNSSFSGLITGAVGGFFTCAGFKYLAINLQSSVKRS